MGKRKSGKRDIGGRLLRPKTKAARAAAPDPGNDRVQQRRATFAIFQGGKAGNEIHDAPGQAWAAGLFDGQTVDDKALRDAARDYANLYWAWYVALLPKSPNLQRSARSSSAKGDTTSQERRFMALDAILGATGRSIRNAVHGLCVDYWGRDETPPWLERCINSRRALRGGRVVGLVASDDDWNRLNCAIDGLLAMTSGRDRQRAA